jgi:hypothetical protein
MPTPFQCHWCDKPTMNETGICIECEQRYEEGNKDIAISIRELETRVRWLEKGLKEMADGRDDMNPIYIKQQAQSILDGEPTTADEYNDVISQYEDHEIQSDIKKVQSKIKDTMKDDEKLVYEEEHNLSPENTVRISDVNKEIAKEWNRDREKKINMITSIGYRGEN